MPGIVVIGAGQAGASLVTKLRALGYEGQVALIGEEHAPPYQRPPLSKKYLLGEMELERLFLRPESFYGENGIDLHLDTRVDAIDRQGKVVVAGGTSIPYEHLVLTTGSVPRRLPGSIGGELRGERGALARTLEADMARGRPGDHVARGVGDRDDRVVERGLDVRVAVRDVLLLATARRALLGAGSA